MRIPALLALLPALVLTGCAGFDTTATAPNIASASGTLHGTAHGGQFPVSGAEIFLFQVGTSGYGSAAQSLVNPGATGVMGGGTGPAYIKTDANGNFTFAPSAYTCVNGSNLTYLVSIGGNPGLPAGNTNNTAINFIAATGPCSGLATLNNVNISELSTAAAVTALQQFIGSGSFNIGAPSSNALGIQNAFLNIPNLVDIGTITSARATPATGTGTAPQALLNSLADILAPCVNSASNTSATCTSLFTNATPSGGTQPTDVFGAMLLIARNPASNVNPLVAQINGQAPFLPTANIVHDFTLGITFTGGGLTNPGVVVIDGSGNAYTGNCGSCNSGTNPDSIVGFGPQGAVLTGTTGITANIHMPQGLAFDKASTYLWSTNLPTTGTNDITRTNVATKTTTAGFPYTAASKTYGVAVDPSGNGIVTDQASNTVLTINTAGTATQTVNLNSFSFPFGVGLDSASNIFVADSSGSIAKIIGTTPTYFTGSTTQPIGISVDKSNNVWTLNNDTSYLSVINNTGTALTSGSGTYLPNAFQVSFIAIDGNSTGWIASSGGTPDRILHVTATGASVTNSTNLQPSGLNVSGTTAIDASGNIWVSNNQGGSLTQILGLASPVVTPIALAVANNKIATNP